MDTIFALASAQGKAGVSVIRVSGENARKAARMLTGSELPDRGMFLRTLRDADGRKLDQALVLMFGGPHSFTGEDVVEFQVHGSTAVTTAVLTALGDMVGIRLAEPGEFTRRALENGKLDLAQVEGLADLIDAETEMQRRQAQVILEGGLGKLAATWRADLVRAASLIEVTIDFADEEVPEDVTPEVVSLLQRVCADLETQCRDVRIAERIRSGFEVAIVGSPNVGKSTLLNCLAGRDAAITSEVAGTTRDVVEVRMDLGGLPVTLLDTAGLRESEDVVENLGIELARKRAARADLRVFLAEPEEAFDIDARPGDIRVMPKADIRQSDADAVSGKTGEGVDSLVARIASELKSRSVGTGIATRERHRQAMLAALENLGEAQRILGQGPGFYDIAAEEIRSAIRALESLVGLVDVENLLDEIFSSFCLGK